MLNGACGSGLIVGGRVCDFWIGLTTGKAGVSARGAGMLTLVVDGAGTLLTDDCGNDDIADDVGSRALLNSSTAIRPPKYPNDRQTNSNNGQMRGSR